MNGAQARITWAAALMIACGLLGVWSSSFWIPTVVATKYLATGHSLAVSQQMASFASLATNFGTLAGCLIMPWAVTRIGSRKKTAALFFSASLICNVFCYFVVLSEFDNIQAFLFLVPILGFFTNGVFALFTIWFPELFAVGVSRGSGLGFTFSLGRVLAAGPILIGALAAQTGSYPVAISLISAIYVPGLLFVILSRETSGNALPA